jgi:hypothetical protein
MAEPTSKPASAKDEDILTLARERRKRAVEFEAANRQKQDDDIRFAAASPDDPWQWPEDSRKERETAGRPCLTINKLPQHIKQVANDIRQNRPSIKYRASNDKAAPEVAEILTGIARHIEACSDADVAYDTAADHEITHGLGYIRVLTEFVSDDSFDQDIRIKRVRDWRKVYLDDTCEDPAGSDAEWAFIDEELEEAEFAEQYPDAEPVQWAFEGESDWFDTSAKRVRVAEYFSIERKEGQLAMWTNGATSFQGDPLPPGVFAGEKPIKTRSVHRRHLMWRKVTGHQILESREYKWKYIPIARVLGNEALVDGKHVVSGLVRNAKDAQRMYNVGQSAVTERVMLSPKAPWDGPAEAFEGHEDKWGTANTQNHAYLPWNHLDEDKNPLPRPQRVQPATVEPGLQQVVNAAADDIKATTGQFDASLGQRSNETSGKAIMARQREGDTATYHYADNLARAVRHVGRIILDMIPTVYDAPRVARMLGEDGSEDFARVDPALPQAYAEVKDDEDGSIQKIFNPSVGQYDVTVTTGPSFTTRRMEAFEAMSQMTQANPQLWQVIGDQLVRNMDWPGADDMAERLKVTLLPQVQQMMDSKSGGEPIPPQAQAQIAQMQEQMQQMQQALQEAGQVIEGKQIETQAKQQSDAQKAAADAQAAQMQHQRETMRLQVDGYKAETERMRAQAELAQKAEAEQIKAGTAIEVAGINAESRFDVEELKGLMQMILVKMQPPPALAADVAGDIQESATK